MTQVTQIPVTEALSAWLTTHIADSVGPFELSLITGGRSNLTYRLVDGEGRWMVLRRPPLGQVLESAHDVVREHRIMGALGNSAVPVPRTLGLCENPSVLGAPFYVMEFADGTVLRSESDVREHLDEDRRGRLSDSLIGCLADIHTVDPDDVGLGNLGPREGYVQRQLRRWQRQFDASRTREVPVIEEVHSRLAGLVPAQQRTRIVHGDFRLDNCLVGSDGEVRAVLDWELCTLGDPLADLGLLMVYWARPDDEDRDLLTGSATVLAGFRERDELVSSYAARTGADVSKLSFYVALGYWKLACIFEGVASRYMGGVMADVDTPGERYAEQAIVLGEAALRTIERH
jgi:aminoglycoside phosphotransferase (APT) family kinase protein